MKSSFLEILYVHQTDKQKERIKRRTKTSCNSINNAADEEFNADVVNLVDVVVAKIKKIFYRFDNRTKK